MPPTSKQQKKLKTETTDVRTVAQIFLFELNCGFGESVTVTLDSEPFYIFTTHIIYIYTIQFWEKNNLSFFSFPMYSFSIMQSFQKKAAVVRFIAVSGQPSNTAFTTASKCSKGLNKERVKGHKGWKTENILQSKQENPINI